MTTCEEIVSGYLHHLAEGFDCHTEGPYTIISTPHFYSDGDNIDIFIEQAEEYIKLSDLGETSRRLAYVNFNWDTKQARSLFTHILNSTGVSSSKGALYVILKESVEFGPKLLDLVQAIQQTDNLVFTIKKYSTQTFRDDVEGFLRKEGFEPELNYQIEGLSGMNWRVHFYLNHRNNILMKALSATSKGGAKYQVVSTYTAYDDIKKRHKGISRAAILDDGIPEIWEPETVRLMESVVDLKIGYWSKKDAFSKELLSIMK